jgi:hypothetical protein
MIEILLDHSYEDDYFIISRISVNIKDASEKERIEKIVEKHNLVGMIGYPDKLFIADLLKVDATIIDFDVNEIDLY